MMRSRRPGKTYALLDVEVVRPLAPVHFSKGISGIAVLVRRKGRPIHYWMKPLRDHRMFGALDLKRCISTKSGARLIKACIRDELTPPVKSRQLPSLTVAVCTRDHPDLLANCLNSLKAVKPDAFGMPVSLEILVVDNAPSTKAARDLASSIPGIRYAVEPRPGLDFARNRAIDEARGELLAYIDDDVVVDSGWLSGLMEAWMRHPDAAGFTGQVLPSELATEAQIIFEQRGGFRRGFDMIRYGQTLDGDPAYPLNAGIFGTGANMAFQKHILRTLGGFDEALDTGPPLPAAGDHDIFYRLIKGGHCIVYQPDFLVFHRHRRGRKALLQQYWTWGLGVMTLIDKYRRADPSVLPKLRYVIRTWLTSRFRELILSAFSRTNVPFCMVVAEIAGGIVGLLGGYSRSVKRIDRIRAKFRSSPGPVPGTDPGEDP